MHFYTHSSTTLDLGHFVSLFWTEQQKTAASKLHKQHLDPGSNWCSNNDAWFCHQNLLERAFAAFQSHHNQWCSLCVPIRNLHLGLECRPWLWFTVYQWARLVTMDSPFWQCLHDFWLSLCCAACLWSHLGTRDSRRLLMRCQNIRSLPLPTGLSWWLRYVLYTF